MQTTPTTQQTPPLEDTHVRPFRRPRRAADLVRLTGAAHARCAAALIPRPVPALGEEGVGKGWVRKRDTHEDA